MSIFKHGIVIYLRFNSSHFSALLGYICDSMCHARIIQINTGILQEIHHQISWMKQHKFKLLIPSEFTYTHSESFESLLKRYVHCSSHSYFSHWLNINLINARIIFGYIEVEPQTPIGWRLTSVSGDRFTTNWFLNYWKHFCLCLSSSSMSHAVEPFFVGLPLRCEYVWMVEKSTWLWKIVKQWEITSWMKWNHALHWRLYYTLLQWRSQRAKIGLIFKENRTHRIEFKT